jgi:hypothetical protein
MPPRSTAAIGGPLRAAELGRIMLLDTGLGGDVDDSNEGMDIWGAVLDVLCSPDIAFATAVCWSFGKASNNRWSRLALESVAGTTNSLGLDSRAGLDMFTCASGASTPVDANFMNRL